MALPYSWHNSRGAEPATTTTMYLNEIHFHVNLRDMTSQRATWNVKHMHDVTVSYAQYQRATHYVKLLTNYVETLQGIWQLGLVVLYI